MKRNAPMIVLALLSTALVGGTALSCDPPVSPEEIQQFTAGMLSGEHLSYGLYGERPIRWLPTATGDEMLRLARDGAFPDDDSLLHVSFIYGSYWQNCRRYYMAYRITGDRRFVEQLRQYARLMDWILDSRPWQVLPQQQRMPRPVDPVATIPHEPAAASNFIGYALAARLTLQIARHDRTNITPAQVDEARRFLETLVAYMDSRVQGDGTVDPQSNLPAVAADVIRQTPYNQSFMVYAVLATAAVALADLQHLDGNDAHRPTIDLYTRIVRAGVDKFIDHSDVAEIAGKPYVFHSHSPADRYEQIRDPNDRSRQIAWWIDGHPVFHYPEDIPHSQSQAWNLVLLWELGEQFGVTERLLAGVANTHVDYVLHGEAPLRDDTIGPPNHILSPWTLKARNNMKWPPLGRPAPVYAIYGPFRADMARALSEQNGRAQKDMKGPKGTQFLLFAHYVEALRQDRDVLHFPPLRP